MIIDNVSIKVREDVDQGLQYWKHNEGFSSDTRQEIADANVLFVPLKNTQYIENSVNSEKVFAPDAESFFRYLLDSDRKEIKADICVNDSEYRRLALYAEPITLTVIGTIVISSVVAPIIKDLILDYIRANRATSVANAEFRITLIVDNENGFIREIQYSGSSADVEKILPRMMEQVLMQARSKIK